MEYYSAIKKNEIMPLATTWIDLNIVVLNTVRQERNIWYHAFLETNFKKDTNENTYKTETDSDF